MNKTPLDAWICHKIAASQPVLTRVEIEAWQLRQLNETLALARARSPFYRRFLEGMPAVITSLDEWSRFPFTTPEDLRHNPLQWLCVSQDEIERVVTLQTSGTTGAPKRIYFTAADQELTVDFFGVGMSTLARPGERVLILLPGETPGSVGDLLRRGLERLGIEPLPYGPVRDPLHALEVIRARQVDGLVGSPTQVLGLARRWPGGRPPRSVLLSTDYVPAAIVRVLEQTWGCEVYNHYGTTEMGLGGGVECAARRGYHLREADLYLEIVDPHSGQVLPEGEPGEVVFTTLTRRGMPFLRYRMGDRSRFLPGACPCGTQLKTLERAGGRLGEFFRVGETRLGLPDFDEALFGLPGLLNFSVRLLGAPGDFSLSIEAQMLDDRDAKAEIENALKSIPALRGLAVSVTCRYAPDEPGSLRKRTLSFDFEASSQ